MIDTAEDLRAEAARLQRESRDSFARCDTDGFLSQWALDISARLLRRQAEIEDEDGTAEFLGLFDAETGERVAAKLIDSRYGLCWALCDESGRFVGKFVSARLKPANLAKKGYVEKMERVPAKAVIKSSGTGLFGAASAYVANVRLDGGYPGCPRYQED